jgi:hypothetical protein
MQYELESTANGFYDAFFVSPMGRVRLGQVVGAKGRWYGRGRDVPSSLGPFRTRGQAAKALAGAKFAAPPMARTGTDD